MASLGSRSVAANERRTLGVLQGDATATRHEAVASAKRTLNNPDERKDGKRKGRPVDERARLLLSENGPERPGDRD
jgi:hypothetical protein